MGMEWCENMDKTLYRVITKGRWGMQMCRRDLTYHDVMYGGLGMMSIAEQYKVNRARVVAGLIEAGSRQQHRGQQAWAKDLLIQDIARKEPLLPIVQEFKTILKQVGVEVIYKPETQEGQWSSQRMKVSLGEERIMKHMQAQHLIYGRGQRVKWLQGKETNLRVISWFEQNRGLGKEELAQAVTQYVTKRATVCEQRQWIEQGGIKIAGGMVMQLVNQMGREVKEMTLGLESGTGLEWLRRRQVGSLGSMQGLVINNTTPKELWVEDWTQEEIQKVVRQMQKQGMIIWMDYSPNNLPNSAYTSGQWEEVVIDAQ